MAAFMRAKILYFMVNLIQINLSKMTDGNIVTSMTDWVLPLGLAGIPLNPLMGLDRLSNNPQDNLLAYRFITFFSVFVHR